MPTTHLIGFIALVLLMLLFFAACFLDTSHKPGRRKWTWVHVLSEVLYVVIAGMFG